jgi:hypothetical protein
MQRWWFWKGTTHLKEAPEITAKLEEELIAFSICIVLSRVSAEMGKRLIFCIRISKCVVFSLLWVVKVRCSLWTSLIVHPKMKEEIIISKMNRTNQMTSLSLQSKNYQISTSLREGNKISQKLLQKYNSKNFQGLLDKLLHWWINWNCCLF